MTSSTRENPIAPDLIESLVEAFVAGGKARPLLPEGRREEVVALLTRLMVDPPLLREYAAALEAERRRRGVQRLLYELDSSELPVEAVAERGLVALGDDQLAELAIDPVAVACLCDFLGEMMAADKVGDVWWRAVGTEGAADLGARERTGMPERHPRIEEAEAHPEGASGPGLSPLRYFLRSPALAATAASILFASGFLSGRLSNRHVESAVVAAVTLSEVPTRGGFSDTVLDVRNDSVRRVFVTVVGLIPEKGAALHYRESQQFIDISPERTRVIQSLPKPFDGATSFLVIVSPYPLGESVREIAKAGLPDFDAEQSRAVLQSGLEGYGHRGFSIQVVRPASGSR